MRAVVNHLQWRKWMGRETCPQPESNEEQCNTNKKDGLLNFYLSKLFQIIRGASLNFELTRLANGLLHGTNRFFLYKHTIYG